MELRKLNILVACEESQAFAIEFRKLGCNAYSCDLQECSGGHPEFHIVGDATKLLSSELYFITQDGVYHYIDFWDCLIAHPPCTYLAKSSSCYLYDEPGKLNKLRYEKLLEARQLFYKFWSAPISFICIENPVPVHVADLPPRSCCINPFEYGEPYSKATCLWLKGLPVPFPELYVPKKNCKSWVYSTRGSKKRSKTFPGIARSLARQWYDFLMSNFR